MSALISWTDADGSASLSNIAGLPVNRFDGWTPDVNSVGDEAIALGTGQLYKFEFRVDDLVSLRIDNLKGSQLTYMRRLKLHLLRGGEVAVSATNELNELFTTCTLAPDTRPTISEPTRENREYSFSVTLKGSIGRLVFRYSTTCDEIPLGLSPSAPLVMVFNGTITMSKLQVSPPGSIVLDVLKNGVSITAAALPTVTAGAESNDVTLVGWDVDFVIGDVFTVEVISSDVTSYTLTLVANPT